MTYKELLKQAINELETAEISSESAQFLMLAYCQKANFDMYANYEKPADDDFVYKYNEGIKRLLKNEPLAYILGYQPFFGYDFKVNNHTFIPRPETEELTIDVLNILDANPTLIKGLDLCTGSGVIAITIALDNETIDMWGSDVSDAALQVALENAQTLNARVTLVQSDLFAAFSNEEKFDFVVCNPPYIKANEKLDSSVVDYEPNLALFAGDDGLDYYHKILAQAKNYLNPDSFLAFEIGYDQAAALFKLAKEYYKDSQIFIRKDFNEKNRMLFIFNGKALTPMLLNRYKFYQTPQNDFIDD